MKKTKEENYKTQIAEILFNSSAPTEIVMWALSNIPDTNKNGRNKAETYNHQAEKISDAVGISKSKWLRFSNLMTKLISEGEKDNTNPSIIVEQNMQKFENDYDLRKFCLSMFICLSIEKAKEAAIKEMIMKNLAQELKKKK